LQLVRIVGKGIEVGAFEDQRAGVLIGVDADLVAWAVTVTTSRSAAISRGRFNSFYMPGSQRDAFSSEGREALGVDLDGIGARARFESCIVLRRWDWVCLTSLR